jgi:hypothetical protein
VSPVRYELSFYIPENGILHSHRRESLKFYKFISTEFLSFFISGDGVQKQCTIKIKIIF